MNNQAVRTTLTLPIELLEATDKAVRDGKARSCNEFVAQACFLLLPLLDKAMQGV